MKSVKYILLQDLADELDMDSSHLHKYIKRMGITPFKQRQRHRGNQKCSIVTVDEADRVRQSRKDELEIKPQQPHLMAGTDSILVTIRIDVEEQR